MSNSEQLLLIIVCIPPFNFFLACCLMPIIFFVEWVSDRLNAKKKPKESTFPPGKTPYRTSTGMAGVIPQRTTKTSDDICACCLCIYRSRVYSSPAKTPATLVNTVPPVVFVDYDEICPTC